MDDDAIRRLARKYQEQVLAEDLEKRRTGPGLGCDYASAVREPALDRLTLEGIQATLRDHLDRGDSALMRPAADALVAAEGLAAPEAPAMTALCDALLEAQTDAVRVMIGRTKGEFD